MFLMTCQTSISLSLNSRMKNFRIPVSIILLAALSLFFAQKDLLHELLRHHDTEDFTCTDFCDHHFSSVHQHCDVLQLAAPPFHPQLNNFSFSSFDLLCVISFESKSSYHFSSSPFLFFRGPPALA